MSFGVNQKELMNLRNRYQKDMVVELISMDDPHAPASGTKGIIQMVDDAGQIHVKWENGSSLAVIPGVDSVRIIG